MYEHCLILTQVWKTMSEDQSISLTSFTTPDTEKSTTLKQTKRKIETIVVDPMTTLRNDDGSDESKVKNVEQDLLKNIKKERVSNKVVFIMLLFIILIILKMMFY